jgi:pyruvate dehydrogenase E1 component beta subunit
MEIGKARVAQEGTDLTLVAWGAMVPFAEQAAKEVQASRGASIELIDLLTISPMDGAAVADSVTKTGRLVIAQEAPKSFGVASEIIASVNDKTLLYLEAPARRVTGYDVVTPYFGRELLFIPSAGRIARAVEETLDF